MRTYLAVPFVEKDLAKGMGARWDPEAKKWYAPNSEKPLIERWPINETPVVLLGEDRSFGGDELFVDLIPTSCWFTNVRYCVNPSDWDRLRNHVYQRADFTCETCHIKTPDLEAHERWSYDNGKKIQKLIRLVALCHQCHQTTHFGYAETQGKDNEAKEHLKSVRKWNDLQCQQHIDNAFKIWKSRNQISWDLDLSLLTSNGIRLAKNPSSDERIGIAEQTLNKKFLK